MRDLPDLRDRDAIGVWVERIVEDAVEEPTLVTVGQVRLYYADAVLALLAAARREERELCAVVARRVVEGFGWPNPANEVDAAIRALSPEAAGARVSPTMEQSVAAPPAASTPPQPEEPEEEWCPASTHGPGDPACWCKPSPAASLPRCDLCGQPVTLRQSQYPGPDGPRHHDCPASPYTDTPPAGGKEE